MLVLLFLSGVFTVILGTVHFFMPVLFDFENAIPLEGSALKSFRLLFYQYPLKRSDVRGIAWVMNHAVRSTLVSIGIALWWFLRVACQFYLGRRRGDYLVCAWFCLPGALHVIAAF